MNDRLNPSSLEIATEAEIARARLNQTMAKLRGNLTPASLYDEVGSAIKTEAGSLVSNAEAAVGRHPFAAMCIAAGAAVLIGTSVSRSGKKPIAGQFDLTSTEPPPVRRSAFAALRAKISDGFGKLADDSFQQVQDRYQQKIQSAQSSIKNKAHDLTEIALDTGEKIIAAWLAQIFASVRPPKK